MSQRRRVPIQLVVAMSALVALEPATASATVPPAAVVTLDDSDAVYLSTGSTPTLLRAGQPGSYPWAASLDGSTSLWTVGTALRQVELMHNGALVHRFDNVAGGPVIGDVSADGSRAVIALHDVKLGGSNTYEVTLATGAVTNVGFKGGLLDLGVSPDGAMFYYLLSNDYLTVCDPDGIGCFPVWLLSLNLSYKQSSVPWSAMSASHQTIAMDIQTRTATGTHDEAWLMTTPQDPLSQGGWVAHDMGPLPAGTVGRFQGNELDVARPGFLDTFLDPMGFPSAPQVSTPMTMTGDPDIVLAPTATLNTTVTVPPAIATFTEPWIAQGSYPTATSTTVYLNRTIPIVPAVQANAAPWNDLFGYWDPRSCYLLYSFDRGGTWASYPWAAKDFVVTRNVWVRATHAKDVNSLASYSAVVQYTAKPYLVVHYTAATRRLYGTANVPTGNIVQVQRRTSTGAWTLYYSRVPVSSYAWGVTLPAGHATWRVVVPATAAYTSAVSPSVST